MLLAEEIEGPVFGEKEKGDWLGASSCMELIYQASSPLGR